MTATVALLPAKDNGDTIAAAVRALLATGRVDRVVVVDDGSTDDTAKAAQVAGAQVVRLVENCGKGAALGVGLRHVGDAETVLLVDADTAESAQAVMPLLDAVRGGADLAIGVLPSAGQRGGHGLVKRVAQSGIRKLGGIEVTAPLSGQRAVRMSLLRRLTIDERFGVEVGMTIDAARVGATIVEVPVEMDHDHKGRSLAGYLHRARQGADVVMALARRMAPVPFRVALVLLAATVVLLAAGKDDRPTTQNLTRSPIEFVVVPDATVDELPNDADAVGAYASPPGSPSFSIPSGSPAVTVPTSVSGEGIRIVIGTGEAGEKALRPVAVYGLDEAQGLLTSDDTRRPGLVTLDDLVAGSVSVTEGTPADLRRLVELTAFYDRIQVPVIVSIGVATTLVLLASVGGRRPGRVLARSATILATVPLALFVIRLADRWTVGHPWLWSALALLLVGIISVMAGRASGTSRSEGTPLDRTGPLRRILFATAAVIVIDLITGAHLQQSGVLGSSPSLGGRYYGIGNPAATVLLMSLVMWTVLHVRASRTRTAALVDVVAAWLVTTLAVGLPTAGADAGGFFAFVATGGLLTALMVKRLRRWSILALPLAAVAIVGAGVLDSRRPEGARTHLGDLFLGDHRSIAEAVGERLDASFFSYGFPYNVIALALFLIGAAVLLASRAWASFLPQPSSLRTGAATALVAGALMFVSNDSGMVVLGLTALVLGPALVIERRSDTLIAANLEVQPT